MPDGLRRPSAQRWGLIWLIAAVAAVVRALLFAGVELYVDEAYYWLWSRRPAFGYFDHPPVVAWLIWAGAGLLPGELGVRIPFVICSGLTVVLTALIARELSDAPRVPVLAALFAASAPMLVLTGGLALPDAPVTAAYAAMCWLACRARGPRWLLVGAAWGLALLSKYPAYFLLPGLVVLLVWDRDFRAEARTRWPWLGLGVALVVFLPNLWWNANHGFVTLTFGVRRAFSGQPALGPLLELAAAVLLGTGPVAAAAGLVALLRTSSVAGRRVAVATLAPVGCFAYSAISRGIEPNWIAFFGPGLCAAAAAVVAGMTPSWRTRLMAGSVALGCLFAAATASELRNPRLLDPARSPLKSLLGGRDLVAKVRQATGDGPDTFVIPSRYQLAAYLAFYGGSHRFGPAYNRASQLDIWNDRPVPGEPVTVISWERVDPRVPTRLGLVGKSLDAVVEVEWRGRFLYRVGVAKFAGGAPSVIPPHTREARPAQ